ncbi:MAG: hypothetical protein FWE76_02120 [Symbiobacteriaceae bacterium]|nr:hypothetical protein [Symbiobacteriaceae bacterium]
MDWYIEVAIILIPALIAFQFFRKYVKPVERVMTWLVLLFAAMPLVQVLNQFISSNNLLPEMWGHLPLQAIATVALVLFMPVRQETKPKVNETETAEKKPTEMSQSNRGHSAPSRRFKKKSRK